MGKAICAVCPADHSDLCSQGPAGQAIFLQLQCRRGGGWRESLLFKWRIECIRLICTSGKTWRKIWSICREAYKIWRSREVQYHLLHESWCLAVNTPLHKWVDFFFHFSLKLIWATCCQGLHLNAFLSWSSELVEVQPPVNSAKLGLTLEDNSHEFHFYSRSFCCQKGYSKHGTCIRINPTPDQCNSLVSAGWAEVHSWNLALHRSRLVLSSSSTIQWSSSRKSQKQFCGNWQIDFTLSIETQSVLAKKIMMKMQMPDAKTDYDNNHVCNSDVEQAKETVKAKQSAHSFI